MKLATAKFKKVTQGFTLIELLVVIAILGVLVVGLMVAINPADKINAANDARVFNDIGAIARASEAYAANPTNAASYPLAIADLVTANELKVAPIAPTGYSYTQTASSALTPPTAQAACTTAGQNCKSIIIISPLKSLKYAATPWWRYESSTGKSCPVAGANLAAAQAAACP